MAIWAEGGFCSGDTSAGNTPGPVYASLLDGGGFGAATRLSPGAEGFFTSALAVPGGGRTVSWSERTGVFSAPLGASGAPAAQRSADGMIPFRADRGGDQVIFRTFPGPPDDFGPGGLAVRPAGGGADEPAPTTGGEIAVAQPGRAVAAVWTPARGWRCRSVTTGRARGAVWSRYARYACISRPDRLVPA